MRSWNGQTRADGREGHDNQSLDRNNRKITFQIRAELPSWEPTICVDTTKPLTGNTSQGLQNINSVSTNPFGNDTQEHDSGQYQAYSLYNNRYPRIQETKCDKNKETPDQKGHQEYIYPGKGS